MYDLIAWQRCSKAKVIAVCLFKLTFQLSCTGCVINRDENKTEWKLAEYIASRIKVTAHANTTVQAILQSQSYSTSRPLTIEAELI